MNLTAFDSRLLTTCRSLFPSCRTSGVSGGTCTTSSISFFSACWRKVVPNSSHNWPTATTPARARIFPLSIFAESSTSLMSVSSRLPLSWTFATQRCCFSVRLSAPSSVSLNPMMLFSGVRSSWLTVDKNSVFTTFVRCSSRLMRASSSTFVSMSAISPRFRSCVRSRFVNMRLNARLRSSNSSPVCKSLRTARSPAAMASAVPFSTFTGFTTTYRMMA